MKVRIFTILAVLVGMLSATVVSAQNLPLLPQDPTIKSCVFSNGLSCYLTENSFSRSVADFSLLRRDYEGDDLVCQHKDVIVSTEVIVDSLLLNLMRRVESDKRPADYAIVICGDIDAATVMKKLKYMSLMVDSSVPSPMPEYLWDGSAKVASSVVTDEGKGLSTIHFEWLAPRTSFANMNTTLPVMYGKAAWELGAAAKTLVGRTLMREDIPYADISYHHGGLTNGFTHDQFAFDVTVASADLERTSRIVTSVLYSLNQGNVDMNDFLLAEHEYELSLEKSAERTVVTNAEYTRLCRDAFLYNYPLSTDNERLAFFRSKDVSDPARKDMFVDIASSLYKVDTPSDTVAIAFSSALLSDTLVFPGQSIKMKINSSRKDAFSGGSIWTFVNGFKVIYKKMPTDGRLYYSMSLSGGFGNVGDLSQGEGAYMSDYLDHCWIAGMKASYFMEALSLSGMSMDVKVGLLNTVISGKVENRNASLLIKSLLAVANERRSNPVELEYFARCEKLRLAMHYNSDIKATLDALLCPGYEYSPFKTAEGVGDETFEKAEALFANLTSKMNDGVLVIVGDVDETELKKLLQMYVGGFDVRNAASRRPTVHYHPVSGWSSYSVEGEKDAAYVIVTSPISMTSANHFASEIAAKIFERRIRSIFEPQGLSVKVSFARGIYPDERFSMMVDLIGECGQTELSQLRDALSECQENITDEELNAYKAYVKNAYARQIQQPEYWLRVIPLRHMEGKDFTTGYESKIDAVSLEMLHNVFKALNEGAGIEYITTKK